MQLSLNLLNTPQRVKNNDFTFIDLFAGIGGIRMGFENAGGNCVFTSEIDKDCQQTYFSNFGEQPFGDITKIHEDEIPSHDVLTAGFPCQPFSISGRQKGFDDTRGTLFFDILRILQKHRPKVVFLENVKHLKYHDGGRTLSVIIRHLEELGYKVSWEVLNATNFGSAQNRERIIIIGSLRERFDFSKLPKIASKKITDIIEQDAPFEYLESSEYTLLTNTKVQKSGLIFVGYRNKSIRKAGVRPNTHHLSRVHKQPNRIYSSEGTHPTLPSQESSGRFWILHDGKVRKLTLTECYRLQGFPEDFKRVSGAGRQYLQIGNAVYVPMMSVLARSVARQLLQPAVKNREYAEGLPRRNLQPV
jgi:DNA (cytosine-5)-methyltransferase 1